MPGLSKFIKPKAGPPSSGSSRGKAAPAKSHEQEVQQRLDLTTKGLGGLATLLVLFALYSVFAQSGLNKAIHTAAPPMVDLSELVPSAGGKAGHGGKDGHGGKEDHAKEAKAANNAKLKLPEGTDPRIDYAFEQIANFENTRSEAVLRNTRATVAGVAPGSVAARSGFRVGDFILSIDGEQAGFVWDSLRKLTAAGKSSVLLEVQRGNEVLRGELMAPEGELLTSSNTGLFFEIPEGYRFIGENDRRELRNGFSRAYMEGLAGDERLAYATSLALLGGNLVKRGVEQADLKPSDAMWLKTEQILGDHHGKFSKALAHHGVVLESMQANLQAGFVKIGALLLAALIAGIAALAAALQLSRQLTEQGISSVKAQLQGLRSELDRLTHSSKSFRLEALAASRASSERIAAAIIPAVGTPESNASVSGDGVTNPVIAAAAGGFTLAELAARVASANDLDEDKLGIADALESSADPLEDQTELKKLETDTEPPASEPGVQTSEADPQANTLVLRNDLNEASQETVDREEEVYATAVPQEDSPLSAAVTTVDRVPATVSPEESTKS